MNNIIKVKETDSTNQLLKKQSEEQALDEGVTLVSGFQTAGKGQRGNRWESEAGKNITCSIILYPEFLPLKQQFLLSEAVALGIKDAVEQYLRPVEIKWPNDIYYQNKKLAGILIENELTGQTIDKSIIGIGLNVNQDRFSSVAPNAVSMKQILGKEIDLDVLLEKTVNAILFRYNTLKDGNSASIVSAYHDSLYRKSGFHLFSDKNGLFSAKTEQVTGDGFLHLTTDEGEKRCYTFKEVSYV
ncbi:MAG: biotin--[acetyl-CoA-carboxylase] ligase [Candidatus Symbiothrix sp.]|jgi:BirA family biotin operon repressor/biotin-[acetyl-CoA-carboxylase] ligase|nr:biotin--[acetyl-CoA-carboxylase] ligase [Candidatus Symbiothrix sp.]